MAKSSKVVKKKVKETKLKVCNPKNKVTSLGTVTIKYDVGFSNAFYIRGKGAGLSWDKGVPLKNIGPDEWIWEPLQSFNECEFKVLINDERYETGENRHMICGANVTYTPSF